MRCERMSCDDVRHHAVGDEEVVLNPTKWCVSGSIVAAGECFA